MAASRFGSVSSAILIHVEGRCGKESKNSRPLQMEFAQDVESRRLPAFGLRSAIFM